MADSNLKGADLPLPGLSGSDSSMADSNDASNSIDRYIVRVQIPLWPIVTCRLILCYSHSTTRSDSSMADSNAYLFDVSSVSNGRSDSSMADSN